MLDEERNVQLLEQVYQMESAFPRNIYTSAHDWGQVLMFQGKSGSVFGSFTKSVVWKELNRAPTNGSLNFC
jgi:hypothetical protein